MRSVDSDSLGSPEEQEVSAPEQGAMPHRAEKGGRFGNSIVRLARFTEQQIDIITLPAAQAAAERQQCATAPPKTIDLSILYRDKPSSD